MAVTRFVFTRANMNDRVRRSFIPGQEMFMPRWKGALLDWAMAALFAGILWLGWVDKGWYGLLLYGVPFVMGYVLAKILRE